MLSLDAGRRVHLVGVGGAGMSAIARVLLGRGLVVSGSDLRESDLTRALAAEGVTVHVGHRASNLGAAELVIVSSAVPAGNPEVEAAHAAGIGVHKRAEALGAMMAGSIGVAVAGTHGKTTTTAMIAHTLVAAGLEPSFIIGGEVASLGTNARHGRGPHFVIEADEYDHTFLGLAPRVAVVTNVEHDHPDIFPTMDAYVAAFRRFVELLPEGGQLVACADDPQARALADVRGRREVSVVTYGLGGGDTRPTLEARSLRLDPAGGSELEVWRGGERLASLSLRLPGRHNAVNALAAWAVTTHLGISPAAVADALASFSGVARRFQLIGVARNVTVIDDYAHHPTEIRAVLAAARARFPGRRLWAVWQPHTFSRTRLLREEFAAAFADADRVIVLDVYASREPPTDAVTAADVVRAMSHPAALHIGERRAAAYHLLAHLAPGDVLLTLGAGDGNAVGEWVLDALARR